VRIPIAFPDEPPTVPRSYVSDGDHAHRPPCETRLAELGAERLAVAPDDDAIAQALADLVEVRAGCREGHPMAKVLKLVEGLPEDESSSYAGYPATSTSSTTTWIGTSSGGGSPPSNMGRRREFRGTRRATWFVATDEGGLHCRGGSRIARRSPVVQPPCPVVGDRLVDVVDEKMGEIGRAPASSPCDREEPIVRRARVPKYPYARISMAIEHDGVVVTLALAHGRRRPGCRKKRSVSCLVACAGT
jgi:hypothetical protein